MSKLVVSNWKMNGDSVLAESFSNIINDFYKKNAQVVPCVLCPPATLLHIFNRRIIGDNNRVSIGGQYCSPNECGSYTGDISANMLADAGCRFVLIGHSERKQFFHETCRIGKHQCLQALKHKLTPIICIGEKDKAELESVITDQLEDYAAKEQGDRIIIAYEPVWAIGNRVEPDLKHIKNAISIIKRSMPLVRVFYGGSVNNDNATEIAEISDGLLVGSASLDGDKFCKILSAVKM